MPQIVVFPQRALLVTHVNPNIYVIPTSGITADFTENDARDTRHHENSSVD